MASAVDGATVVIGYLPAGLRSGGWASSGPQRLGDTNVNRSVAHTTSPNWPRQERSSPPGDSARPPSLRYSPLASSRWSGGAEPPVLAPSLGRYLSCVSEPPQARAVLGVVWARTVSNAGRWCISAVMDRLRRWLPRRPTTRADVRRTRVKALALFAVTTPRHGCRQLTWGPDDGGRVGHDDQVSAATALRLLELPNGRMPGRPRCKRHLAGRHTALVTLRTGAGIPRPPLWPPAPFPGLGTGRLLGLRHQAWGHITVAGSPRFFEPGGAETTPHRTFAAARTRCGLRGVPRVAGTAR